MKDRRKHSTVSSGSRFFRCTLFGVFCFVLFTGFSFSTFRLFFAGERFHPEIVPKWRTPAMKAVSGDSPTSPVISIGETVTLPDQVLVFLKYPQSAGLFTRKDLDCAYFSANSSQPQLRLPPNRVDGDDLDTLIVRCPSNPRGLTVSLVLKSGAHIHAGPARSWESLAYEAMIDRDNTTIVFVKGLNLRRDRLYDPSRFECVYGWDLRRPKFSLRSNVISIAQEIVRCKTPLSILSTQQPRLHDSVKVSVRVKGRGTVPSIARPRVRPATEPDRGSRKPHQMCVCTVLRNQARFLREWVIYHDLIGAQRWYIYDNNSEDDIDGVIGSLRDANYSISRHVWPWIKAQEAGFAHCALRARSSCEWIGFIDVDEFLHLPTGSTLRDVLSNQSRPGDIGEVRVSCHSFGPSGLKHAPTQGVMVGYTCRMAAPERHKSIVRPEALNSTLINGVHHFHLRDGFRFLDADRGTLVINHYKYQVWEVFKEKFYRRVATYVADWQDEQNVGSKDRAPGLGTRAIEPPDWSSRFCEVTDTGLREMVLQNFKDPLTGRLPWHEGAKKIEETFGSRGLAALQEHHRHRHRHQHQHQHQKG